MSENWEMTLLSRKRVGAILGCHFSLCEDSSISYLHIVCSYSQEGHSKSQKPESTSSYNYRVVKEVRLYFVMVRRKRK